jgi:hypothetical protein
MMPFSRFVDVVDVADCAAAIVAVVVTAVAVEQTMYSIYNIIIGRGCLGLRVSPRRGAHFCSFWSSRLGKVMGPQNEPLPTTNRAARSIRKNRISNNNDGHPKSSHTVGGSFKRSNNNATTKTTTKHFTPLGERRG